MYSIESKQLKDKDGINAIFNIILIINGLKIF